MAPSSCCSIPTASISASYDRGRNVSVLERPRPDYEAIGVKVGGFTLYPKVTVDGTYDDNIFATTTGQASDFIFTEVPELDFQSNWARNAVGGYVKLQADQYVNNTTEDAVQYAAGLNGKYQLGEQFFTGGVDFSNNVLPRSASNNVAFTVHRIPYDYTSLYGQYAATFTRVRFTLRFDFDDFAYSNGLTPAGTTVVFQDQNHVAETVTGKAEMAISPDAAVYVTAAWNNQSYELNPPAVPFTRNSDGYDIEAGGNFDITHLVRGEVQLGYLDEQYASPLFRPISGLSGKVQLQWFPTELTTVTLVGSRSVQPAGVPNSAGFLTTNGSLQVDHELLRNLILSANGWIGYDQYNGIDRKDQRDGAKLSAHWLVTRHFGLTFAYAYSGQTSSGTASGPAFHDNQVTISAVFQY